MRILITGGSSDIAQAVARRRAALGDEIVVTASSQKSLDDSLAKLKGDGIAAEGFVFEFSRPSDSDKALQEQLNRGLDAVVLNAFTPLAKIAPLGDIDFTELTAYLRLNVEGNLWLLHKVLPSMKARGFGRLILISSLTAETGTANYGIYGGAKAALEGILLNLAVDYGGFGVLSNIVRLGLFKTSRTALFWKRQEYRTKMAAIIPQGGLGEPSQAAEALDPLLSPTSYINGTVLRVSGGLPLTAFGRSP